MTAETVAPQLLSPEKFFRGRLECSGRRVLKMNPIVKKNFAIFPILDWIATLTAHIPNKVTDFILRTGDPSYSQLIQKLKSFISENSFRA